jgi:hypothetical protein
MSRGAANGFQQPAVGRSRRFRKAEPAPLDLAASPERLASPHSPPPSVAVTGECKSGKSSLLNALLGSAVLPTGVRVHIPYPVLLTYASNPSLAFELANRRRVATDWDAVAQAPLSGVRRLRVGMPIDDLRAIRLIDTPGDAAGHYSPDHQALAACRRAHVVIWCTPAVQAWKASEQDAWLGLVQRLRAKRILAVTYKDLVASDRDLARLGARLRAEAAPYFDDVVMVASNEALRARQLHTAGQRERLWRASGGTELITAVRTMIAAALGP